MKIVYNVTGKNERKRLAAAVAEITGMPATYLGAPTFAYEAGGYTIDRNGMLTGDDNPALVSELKGSHGFTVITEEYDTPVAVFHNTAIVPPEGRYDPYSGYEEPTEDAGHSLTIEVPRAGLSDSAIVNLKKLVESKASLIKKALDTDFIPVIAGAEKVSFPWFRRKCTDEEVDAYTRFVSALCGMADRLTRVNAVEKPVENEKYAFRVFLIRLGFVGDDFKSVRKILLKNLSGNGAFRNPPTNR